eukprot:superscaffoldBa00000356_g4061
MSVLPKLGAVKTEQERPGCGQRSGDREREEEEMRWCGQVERPAKNNIVFRFHDHKTLKIYFDLTLTITVVFTLNDAIVYLSSKPYTNNVM